MKNLKHTPKHFQEMSLEFAPIDMDEEQQIGYVEGYNEALKNTSAPELLEALELIKGNFEVNLKYGTQPTLIELEAGLRIIKNAIKKATE